MNNNFTLEELHKLADKLTEYDFDDLNTIVENRRKPVFNRDLYKTYYGLIAKYPQLYGYNDVLKYGYYVGIFHIYELMEINKSPFDNLLHKYCRAHHWYKVYNNLYKEGDKRTCPVNGQVCESEDDCFNGIFGKLSMYMYVLRLSTGSKDIFEDHCKAYGIPQSIPDIEKEISRIALEIRDMLPDRFVES